jgi:hypothetical protein
MTLPKKIGLGVVHNPSFLVGGGKRTEVPVGWPGKGV